MFLILILHILVLTLLFSVSCPYFPLYDLQLQVVGPVTSFHLPSVLAAMLHTALLMIFLSLLLHVFPWSCCNASYSSSNDLSVPASPWSCCNASYSSSYDLSVPASATLPMILMFLLPATYHDLAFPKTPPMIILFLRFCLWAFCSFETLIILFLQLLLRILFLPALLISTLFLPLISISFCSCNSHVILFLQLPHGHPISIALPMNILFLQLPRGHSISIALPMSILFLQLPRGHSVSIALPMSTLFLQLVSWSFCSWSGRAFGRICRWNSPVIILFL